MIHVALRRSIAGILFVSLAACSTVQPVARPREFITARTPSMIWLTRSGQPGSSVLVEGPRILGDTLAGFVDGKYMEMHVEQIGQMHARQHSRGRTIALVAGMALATLGLSFLVGGGHGGGDDYEEEGFRPRR